MPDPVKRKERELKYLKEKSVFNINTKCKLYIKIFILFLLCLFYIFDLLVFII